MNDAVQVRGNAADRLQVGTHQNELHSKKRIIMSLVLPLQSKVVT